MNPLRSAPAAWDVVAPTSQRDLRATVSATSAGSVASTRATASECPAPAVEPRLQRVLRAAGAATLESMPRKTATDPNTGQSPEDVLTLAQQIAVLLSTASGQQEAGR
ncbi:hypothetical protein PF010_g8414 [Phytophthora fragariae]|uniref:Uncharacterized protein n=1 Tax=Phytophthora fragariae TaxID=53985 RepID=A0A6A3L911_9STRA|nr:hypothetical protein PF009_g10610 [Phytophthora fragariae]KAE9012383.1 hypothetical protein PF011_g8941 [Phytophthora fragariae]KAE9096387.1 hypothetical protein PF007_g17021 [Phytophthora fragariae]KAE9117937.1 hypothetical protein PF010_g8414 [Phytophthora fragariae]KAE9146350.1 hypothetical protein PF006_g8880 [Phytophthora fragariae]